SLTTTALVVVGIDPTTRQFVLADLAIWAGVFTIGWWIRRDRAAAQRRSASGETTMEGEATRVTQVDWILRAGFAATVLVALAAVIASLRASPHGDWDAWAIWNQHARFLFRGGDRGAWRAMFAIEWAQPDYPLLMPAAMARTWAYAGQETVLAPAWIALVF